MALKHRHLMYNRCLEEIRQMEADKEIFVIRPSRELTIGRMEHDPGKLQEVYELGRKDAQRGLPELQEWLKTIQTEKKQQTKGKEGERKE